MDLFFKKFDVQSLLRHKEVLCDASCGCERLAFKMKDTRSWENGFFETLEHKYYYGTFLNSCMMRTV